MNRYQRKALRQHKRASEAAGMTTAYMDDAVELEVASEVRDLYEAMRLKIISFSQPRATMQTPGIPDWRVYCERKGIAWWVELKREKGGKQGSAQVEFQRMAERCGEEYVLIDSREVAFKHLVEVGLICVIGGEAA